MKPTIYTWILAIFGAITFLPLMMAQLIMLLKPKSQLAKDLIIGKGKEWRDHTHFRSALAFAWADIFLIFPLLVIQFLPPERAATGQRPVSVPFPGSWYRIGPHQGEVNVISRELRQAGLF